MIARRATAAGLAAAALFGASTPAAKLLVPGTRTLMLAGLLYLGAGLGLTLFAPFRRADNTIPDRIDVEVRAGRCACERKNPSGACCLGDVRRPVKEAKAALGGTSPPSDSGRRRQRGGSTSTA